MPTFPEVRASVASRLETALPAVDFRYPNGDLTLPDTPVAYVYVEISLDAPEIVGFGGGRGSNLQRTTGAVEAHVMVPANGQGADAADALAESICAVFRGTRIDGVSCFSAQVDPVGGATEDGVYAHPVTAIAYIQFDQSA